NSIKNQKKSTLTIPITLKTHETKCKTRQTLKPITIKNREKNKQKNKKKKQKNTKQKSRKKTPQQKNKNTTPAGDQKTNFRGSR
ncbi:hypothetical protein NK288_23750, partial [Salmonella enterica]|uniref:hypothetical protein n=1 Tax=Salmonella enterica TaxID=28901 RepID=UPI0022B60C1E